MNYKILVKPTFQREAKRMAKHYRSFAKDYETLIEALEQNPHLVPTSAVVCVRYAWPSPRKDEEKVAERGSSHLP